jgi:hypothetical protein
LLPGHAFHQATFRSWTLSTSYSSCARNPQWRGHQYFVVRDDIIIVDRSRKIVAVVPVGSSGGGAQLGAPGAGALNLTEEQIRHVQIAHGFTVELLADMVRAGLATAQIERAYFGGQTRVHITDAGRRALRTKRTQ